jgi:hypothetical protein
MQYCIDVDMMGLRGTYSLTFTPQQSEQRDFIEAVVPRLHCRLPHFRH